MAQTVDYLKALEMAQKANRRAYCLLDEEGNKLIPFPNNNQSNADTFFNEVQELLQAYPAGKYQIQGRNATSQRDVLRITFRWGQTVNEQLSTTFAADRYVNDPETQKELIRLHKELTKAELDSSIKSNKIEILEERIEELESELLELENNSALADQDQPHAIVKALNDLPPWAASIVEQVAPALVNKVLSFMPDPELNDSENETSPED